ncbi:hypothetical protein MLD52_21640 [Puniceicoccaceae bacterium K14]|nr:hypothetical protein [Puniceicoccaceae bacterium K14]
MRRRKPSNKRTVYNQRMAIPEDQNEGLLGVVSTGLLCMSSILRDSIALSLLMYDSTW